MRPRTLAAALAGAVVPLLAPLGAAHAAGAPGMTATSSCFATPGTIRMHAFPSGHGTIHADVSLRGIAAPSWSGLLTWDVRNLAQQPQTTYDGSTGSISVSGDSVISWPSLTYAGFQPSDNPRVGCVLGVAHVGQTYFMGSSLWAGTVVASRTGSVKVEVDDVRKGEHLTVTARVQTNHGWQRRVVKVVAKKAIGADRIVVPGFGNLAGFRKAEFVVARPKFGVRHVFSMVRD